MAVSNLSSSTKIKYIESLIWKDVISSTDTTGSAIADWLYFAHIIAKNGPAHLFPLIRVSRLSPEVRRLFKLTEPVATMSDLVHRCLVELFWIKEHYEIPFEDRASFLRSAGQTEIENVDVQLNVLGLRRMYALSDDNWLGDSLWMDTECVPEGAVPRGSRAMLLVYTRIAGHSTPKPDIILVKDAA